MCLIHQIKMEICGCSGKGGGSFAILGSELYAEILNASICFLFPSRSMFPIAGIIVHESGDYTV